MSHVALPLSTTTTSPGTNLCDDTPLNTHSQTVSNQAKTDEPLGGHAPETHSQKVSDEVTWCDVKQPQRDAQTDK